MRRIVLVAAGAGLVLSTTPLAACAQDYAWPGFYLAAAGTYAIENFDEEVEFDDGAGFNLRAGNRVNRWAALEVEFEWLTDFDAKDARGEVEAWTLMANMRGYPFVGRLQPFGLFGLGLSTSDVEVAGDSDDEVGFGIRAGAGVEVYLTEYLAMTFEGGYVVSFGDTEDLDYATASAGLLFRM